jgi:hypothetical protein
MLGDMAEADSPDDVERLRSEVEELRSKNERLTSRVAMGGRLRRAAVVFLLVLGCGLSGAAVIALWTRVTVLNTDRYVETMSPIAKSKSVQKTVVDKLDKAIFGSIDVTALAREVLPDKADVLAPAIANGVDGAIRTQLTNFVASDRFQTLWDEANRRAHTRVVGLLTTGRSGRLELKNDTVYLDLSAAVDTVKQKLHERGFDRIADAIPPTVDGKIPLLTSDGFSSARRGINIIKGLSWLLPLLALLCFAGHILMSRPRRRGWLRVALGLAVTGLVLLALVGIGRTYYLDSINQDVLPRDAAADIFDSLLSLLRGALRIAVLGAVVLAVLSLLAGKPARRAAETTGPVLRSAAARVAAHPASSWVGEHRGAVQWSLVLFGGLVLVAWDNPTAWVVLIDAALIALAVWVVALLARGGRQPAS